MGHLFSQDQIRLNIIPTKLKDEENDALTAPVSLNGTAEEVHANEQSPPAVIATHIADQASEEQETCDEMNDRDQSDTDDLDDGG